MRTNRWLLRSALFSFTFGFLLTMTPLAQAATNPNPGVFPVSSKPYGATYGQWSAKWWQWALSIPASSNPLLDTTGANCAVAQSGPVWFLAGTFGTSEVRACTIPSRNSILFPVINTECSTIEGNGSTETELRACAKFFMDAVSLLEASVDGKSLVKLTSYRFVSPLYTFTLPSGDILGLGPGSSPSVADGFWIMLQPLEAGTHAVHFKGGLVLPGFAFETEATYTLTIVD